MFLEQKPACSDFALDSPKSRAFHELRESIFMKTFLSLLFLCILMVPAPGQETDAQSNEQDSSGSVSSGSASLDLSKMGSGTLILTGENSYLGGSVIHGGVLTLPDNVSFHDLVLSNSGTIDSGDSTLTVIVDPFEMSDFGLLMLIEGGVLTVNYDPSYPDQFEELLPLLHRFDSVVVTNGHLVTFVLSNHGTESGNTSLVQIVGINETAKPPTLTVDPGWIFTGWSSEPSGIAIDDVTADVTFTATYEADSDLDGWSDETEALMGTNPENAQDHFQHQIRWKNGQVKIDYFPHSPDCLYEVQWTDDLTDPDSWQTLPGASFQRVENRRTASITPNGNSAQNFYRIRVLEGE